MPEEEIKWIFDALHDASRNHQCDHYDDWEGGMWSGYTRGGFEVTYYPETDTYTWRYLFDNGVSVSCDDFIQISKMDLIEKLRKYNRCLPF